MLFQSLGGRYTFRDAVRHLTVHGNETHRELLRKALTQRYDGEATLYHKGRAALSEAIRLATGGSGNVAVSGLTCYTVVQAVQAAGCRPVFVDIDEKTLQPSVANLDAACQQYNVRAIILQHMLGIPADIDGLEQMAQKHSSILIEDLAHSAGATYPDGREVGTVAPYTVLSFGRDKALDAVNGGALIIRTGVPIDRQPAKSVRISAALRDRMYPLLTCLTRGCYRVGGKYIMAIAMRLGLVTRSADGGVDVSEAMSGWQAAVAYREVICLESTVAHRRVILEVYSQSLKKPLPKGLLRNGVSPIRVPLLVSNRQVIIKALNNAGVHGLDSWYDVPVGPERFFSEVHYPADKCPVAVSVARRIMNIPTHRRIGANDAQYIAFIINEVAEQ